MSRSERTGASMGGRVEMSKSKRRALARRRRAEEAEWQARSGPVRVVRPNPEPEADDAPEGGERE